MSTRASIRPLATRAAAVALLAAVAMFPCAQAMAQSGKPPSAGAPWGNASSGNVSTGTTTSGTAPPNAFQGFSTNRDQPVEIESATLEVRDKAKTATFLRDVKLGQG